jgi:LacI family transcriptional regulator, galactose operon repressor
VTIMTVSRVIRDRREVAEATRQRVRAAMDALGYTPNAMAQGLRTQRTQVVALLIGNITNPFFTLVARGFEEAVSGQGYLTMVCNTDQSPDQEAEYLDHLLRRHVDGFAISPADVDDSRLKRCLERGVPFVMVDREVPGLAVDGVSADARRGAAAATRHLIEAHGHRRIAALFGPEWTSISRERRAGYEDALRAAGLPLDPGLLDHCPFTVEAGRTLAQRLLSRHPRPAALLAASNFLTAGALEACARLGLDVPNDVALIGFGPIPRTPLERQDLSLVGAPAKAMGYRAGELLVARIADSQGAPPRHERFPTELVLSRSCGCPPASGESTAPRTTASR